MCYFYENKTSNKTLVETLRFEFKGLEIVGYPPNTTSVKIEVKPGETKLVELKAVFFPWNLKAGFEV